jgi:tetratricopeptide (TPR) repeat protein
MALLNGCATASRHASATTPQVSPPASRTRFESAVKESAVAEQRVQAQAHFAMGVLEELHQKPESALDEFYRAASADPGNEILVVEVARRFIQNKQTDKALALLNKAAAVPTAGGDVYAWQGLAYAQLNKKDLAAHANREALKRAPQLLQAYQNLVQLYLAGGQAKDALKVLDEAIRQAPANALYLVELADLMLENLKQLERSGVSVKPRLMAVLDRAANLKPTNPLLLQKLADGYRVANENGRAAGIYRQLLETYPDLPGLREKLTEIYLRNGERTNAIAQLELIVREHPTRPQGYYLLGSLAGDNKEFDRAVELFRKAILMDPNFEAAYYDLAATQITMNQPQAALDTLEKARERYPQSYAVELYSALAYGRLKQYTKALTYFTAAEVVAKATDPKKLNPAFYFHLAATYERNHDYPQAETYFKKCLELSPDNSEAMNYLGYMWAEQGTNLKEARVLIEKALKREPKNGAYLDSLGWVLYKMKQPREALRFVQQSLENTPESDPVLFDHLGDIHAALEQYPQARQAWQKSLAIEPNEVIQKKLQSIPANR